MSAKERELRRTYRPYAAFGLAFIFCLVLIGCMASQSGARDTVEALLILCVPFGTVFFIGSRYRIFLKHDVLHQFAFGKPEVSIPIDEITRIKRETSDAGTLLRAQRPFRRITVYGNAGKFIDISLKHFAKEDIDWLMTELGHLRPDLSVPE